MNQLLKELVTKAKELQQLAEETNQHLDPHSYEDSACGELYQSLSTWLGGTVGEDSVRYR